MYSHNPLACERRRPLGSGVEYLKISCDFRCAHLIFDPANIRTSRALISSYTLLLATAAGPAAPRRLGAVDGRAPSRRTNIRLGHWTLTGRGRRRRGVGPVGRAKAVGPLLRPIAHEPRVRDAQ
jgi:hypothetical protein